MPDTPDLDSLTLAFAEDGGLTLHTSVAEVPAEYEGVDVLSDVFIFYAADGHHLAPVFDEAVIERRILWLFHTVSAGRYHLERQASSDADPLWLALLECTYLTPNEYFASLSELKSHLRQRGTVLDRPVAESDAGDDEH